MLERRRVRLLGQRPGGRPVRLGLPLGRAADDVGADGEQRLLRLTRVVPASTSTPSTRSMPANASALGRLPAWLSVVTRLDPLTWAGWAVPVGVQLLTVRVITVALIALGARLFASTE